MSNNSPPSGVGRTLAGGVQDVAAILPLIGTEQCEKHTSSALKGGYLYASAAPLSIFGSLGIVKAGIAVLMSSISISIPRVSFSFRDSRPSIKYSGWRKWLGGRMLKDAGFELTGVVAPLIGMDRDRFRAETHLVEMLEEKHIDDPEMITVEWKSRHWNFMLVVSTTLCAALSITPYIALLLGPVSWRPQGIHLPWLFPALRIVGSCTAAIACQFIIQFRVISLMKNRILFMIIRQRLQLQPIPAERLEWDENLPAERCLWSLKQYFSSGVQLLDKNTKYKKSQDQTVIQQDDAALPKGASDHISIPVVPTTPRNDIFDIHTVHKLQREHFPTPMRDAALTTLLWILLGLSLPATVAGYIGCFTLVSATPTQGNGPLVWVGLEAALSILRIVIWASNPRFDEETDITLKLELSNEQPIFPTDVYNPSITNLVTEERKPLTLVPEREFLERMTPFIGPLDQFQRPNNITLYFTLVPNRGISETGHEDSATGIENLLMTVFDLNMQLGVTFGVSQLRLGWERRSEFDYFDVIVKYDSVIRKFQAHIQSEKRRTQPWRLEDDNLFASLHKYHEYVFYAFTERKKRVMNSWHLKRPDRYGYSKLALQWDISNQSQSKDGFRAENPIAKNSQSYVDGMDFEYHSKTQLIINWAAWIVNSMHTIQSHTRIDCHEVLKNEPSNKARWELAELDSQLAWEWANRELVLLTLSLELEEILRSKIETCANEISRVRRDEQVITWMRADFEIGRAKRMEQERESAKQRMEKAMTNAHKEAEGEGRPWRDDGFSPQWTQATEFIERQWSAGINNRREALTEAEDELKMLIQNQGEQQRQLDNERYTFVEQFKKQIRHEHWSHQRKVEEDVMKATIEYIRTLPVDSTRWELDKCYKYPEPDRYATAKFARLADSSSMGKACSATVYYADYHDREAVCNVIAKSTTRSVVGVDPDLLASIPPNDHLLFLHSSEEKEPDFVKQNRDRWWDQQTENASMFYFSPRFVENDGLCCSYGSGSRGAIAHVLIFLAAPSIAQIGVLHQKDTHITLSIRENGLELGSVSHVPSKSFRLDNCKSFVLQPGRHELELVPIGGPYFLRDIFITLSDIPTA